jgi:hypothetical protein
MASSENVAIVRDFRVLQLTPPGSACSIAVIRNMEGRALSRAYI